MDRIPPPPPPPKSVVDVAKTAAAGGAAGAAAGATLGAAVGGPAGAATGALGGGIAGVVGGAVWGLTDDSKGAAGRARGAASALWDVTATFAGSALSLGTAFSMQTELTSLVARYIELSRGGTPLTPSERALVRAAFDGLAWSALSPVVGLSAAAVGSTFNTLRRAINAAFEGCGRTAPLQRIVSPGYLMSMMDWAALALAVGAAVRSYQGTMAALEHHPFQTTATSALDSPPASWVAGIGGGIAVALGYLCTGLAERNNGGLRFGPVPPFSAAAARDLAISRVISMARSGLVQVGPLPGLVMWGLRAVLAAPGAVLDQFGAPHRVIALTASGLTALIIGTMANEWFTQCRRNDNGAPGERMDGQLVAVRDAKIPVQTRRWTAELAEARAERASPRDGDTATEILRDVSEAVGAAFFAGTAIGAAINEDQFRLEDSAITEFLERSVLGGSGAIALAFVFQMIALRAVTGDWARNWSGRDDPLSQRTGSDAAAMAAGGLAAAAAASGRVSWVTVPAAAWGVGIEMLVEVWRRRRQARDGMSLHPEAARAELPLERLERNGRGRLEGESLLQFLVDKWLENIVEPVVGRTARARPPGPGDPARGGNDDRKMEVVIRGDGGAPAADRENKYEQPRLPSLPDETSLPVMRRMFAEQQLAAVNALQQPQLKQPGDYPLPGQVGGDGKSPPGQSRGPFDFSDDDVEMASPQPSPKALRPREPPLQQAWTAPTDPQGRSERVGPVTIHFTPNPKGAPREPDPASLPRPSDVPSMHPLLDSVLPPTPDSKAGRH